MGSCYSTPTRPSVASHYPRPEPSGAWKRRGSWAEPDGLFKDRFTNQTSIYGPNRDAMPP